MVLWDLPIKEQDELLQLMFEDYGELKGIVRSPYSKIYFFDGGPARHPSFTAAKGIVLDSMMEKREQEKTIKRVLFEINNTYSVCHHHLIHRFGDIKIILGIPFTISRKRELDLKNLIAKGPITTSEVLSISVQIAHALNYCKSQHIDYHQDLKPENIFIDPWPSEIPLKYKVAVADFELSNAYHFLQINSGSRPYMPLEQYLSPSENPENDVSKIDVFALGVIMVEMLTGGIHPIGKKTSDIWPTQNENESKQWSRERPWKKWLRNGAKVNCNLSDTDPRLVNLIHDCLQIDVTQRISSQNLESELMLILLDVEPNIHENLKINLEYFDRNAKESGKLGWPYMEKLIKQIDSAFSD